MKIACIGSRDIGERGIAGCQEIGERLVASGHVVRTGGAVGADQAFARGGAEISATAVEVCLPWPSYERSAVPFGARIETYSFLDTAERARLLDEAARHHPNWKACSSAARALHARNGLILDGCGLVLAWPRRGKGGPTGGTAQGMRVAVTRGIEVVDLGLLDAGGMERLVERLREMV